MKRSTTLPFVWGANAAECGAWYPCDEMLPAPQHAFFRAVDIAAPVPHVFRWLQQLRIAPYSYDALDNFLLPSPSRLTPRAACIEVGQRMMHVMRICAFEPDRSLTLGTGSRLATALLGTLYGTYTLTALPGGTRLCVKVNAIYPRSIYGRVAGPLMPWIDLLMMRKQLQRLKAYAERGAGIEHVGPGRAECRSEACKGVRL